MSLLYAALAFLYKKINQANLCIPHSQNKFYSRYELRKVKVPQDYKDISTFHVHRSNKYILFGGKLGLVTSNLCCQLLYCMAAPQGLVNWWVNVHAYQNHVVPYRKSSHRSKHTISPLNQMSRTILKKKWFFLVNCDNFRLPIVRNYLFIDPPYWLFLFLKCNYIDNRLLFLLLFVEQNIIRCYLWSDHHGSDFRYSITSIMLHTSNPRWNYISR